MLPEDPQKPKQQKQVYRRVQADGTDKKTEKAEKVDKKDVAHRQAARNAQPPKTDLLPPGMREPDKQTGSSNANRAAQQSLPKSSQKKATSRQPKAKSPMEQGSAPSREQVLQRRRLILLIALAVLALLICLFVWLFSRNAGPEAPAQPDIGTPAAAWAKNEKGYYFNDAGEPILEAVKKGIDVSHHQGTVDWNKAKAAGIDFAILRCGYGGEWTNSDPEYKQDDTQWRRNADACTELGIPFGVYLYSYATTEEDARSEADHAARLLGLCDPPREGLESYTNTPYQLSLPFYYDLEDPSLASLLPQEMAKLTAAFFDQLESYGYQGEQGVYASLNWVRCRMQDPGFDPWRDNLWIARYASEIGYTGPYSMWQSSNEEPGSRYGVESDTVDIDFVMEDLSFTGIEQSKGDVAPAFLNDTRTDELWLASKNDRATLLTDQTPEQEGGQRVFWQSSDETIATVNRRGEIRARGPGSCIVTATLADGRLKADCTVRVGDVTVPVIATGNLSGIHNADTQAGLTLADAAALKTELEDAVLVDAGGSLHGTAETSVTGGRVMTDAFAAADYDVQAIGGADLAYGVARLLTDAASAKGPTLAANLRTDAGAPLLYRATAWGNARVGNGMNTVLTRCGRKIGFFALCGGDTAFAPYATPNESAVTAEDLARIANEQVSALKTQGSEAIICLLAPPISDADRTALQETLAQLGVTALIDGSLATAQNGNPALPTLAAGGGMEQLGRLDVTFTASGKVEATVTALPAAGVISRREQWSGQAREVYYKVLASLAKLAQNDSASLSTVLFTLSQDPAASAAPVPFDAYVAGIWRDIAEADRAAWAQTGGDAPLWALAGGVGSLENGDITVGDLLGALPGGERLQLVLTTAGVCQERLENGGVAQPWLDTVSQQTVEASQPALLVTDTSTLRAIGEDKYTVVRDYGDVYWRVRMAISDATAAFEEEFHLPLQPELGAGRTS